MITFVLGFTTSLLDSTSTSLANRSHDTVTSRHMANGPGEHSNSLCLCGLSVCCLPSVPDAKLGELAVPPTYQHIAACNIAPVWLEAKAMCRITAL